MENSDNLEKIDLPIDNLYDFENFEIYEEKFNIMTTLQMKIYDNLKYKPEDKIKIKNEKGEDEEKDIALTNYIRWKNTNTNTNNNKDKDNKDAEINDGEKNINKLIENTFGI